MIAGQKVIVAKPMTYMNLSGESVRELVNYYKVNPESELIVVYDDISLAPGQIRIRKKEARAPQWHQKHHRQSRYRPFYACESRCR